MHTKPMEDNEGTFSEPNSCKSKCPKCGKDEVEFKVWESSCGGYEDYKYRCNSCGHRWWVEGADA